MFICKACGFSYEPGEKVHFCEKCGAKFEEESLTAVERKEAVLRAVFAETTQKDSGEKQPAGEPLFAQTEKVQNSSRKKKRNRQNKGSNPGNQYPNTENKTNSEKPASGTGKATEKAPKKEALHPESTEPVQKTVSAGSAEHKKDVQRRNYTEHKTDAGNKNPAERRKITENKGPADYPKEAVNKDSVTDSRTDAFEKKQVEQRKKTEAAGRARVNPLVVVLAVLLFAIIVAAAGILILCMTGVIQSDRVFGKAVFSLSSVSVNLPVDGSSRVVIENYADLSGGDYTVSVQPVRAVEVEEKGDTLLLTGEKEGMAVVTLSAKGFQNAEILVEVTAKDLADNQHSGLFTPEGRAFETDLAKYYFLDGGLYFSLSEKKNDYICGNYRIERTDFLSIDEASRQALDTVLGTDWSLYHVSIEPKTDVYCGYEMSNPEAMDVYVAYYGDHVAIVDYNWYGDGAREAKEIGLLSQGKLEDTVYAHMPGKASGGIALQTGTVPREKLNGSQISCGNWAFAYHEETKQIYQLRDRNLYTINYDDLGTEIQPVPMEGIETDSIKQMVADYGQYLFYTKIPYEGGSVQLCFYAYETGMEYPLSQGFSIQDFVVTEEAVYATDYKEIRKICYDGSSETIYEGPVCAFLIQGTDLYVFDFYTWNVMDANTGENLRKLSLDTTGHSYEVDHIYAYDNLLVFAAFDREDETVAVYSLDMDQEELCRISDLYEGTASDVYHTAVDDQGGMGFSVEDGKRFIYLELYTGAADAVSTESMYMSGISEIAAMHGDLYFETYDLTGVNRHVYQYVTDTGEIKEIENLAIIKEETDEE